MSGIPCLLGHFHAQAGFLHTVTKMVIRQYKLISFLVLVIFEGERSPPSIYIKPQKTLVRLALVTCSPLSKLWVKGIEFTKRPAWFASSPCGEEISQVVDSPIRQGRVFKRVASSRAGAGQVNAEKVFKILCL